jgi:hypothetical protein
MEHEHGALLERQPPEGAFELIAVIDGQDVGRLELAVHVENANVCLQTAPTPGLCVALVGQYPVQPGFESIGIAQRSELTSGRDERGLHRVICSVCVSQDPERNRHALIAHRAGEGIEGLSVALFRTYDERSLHPTLPLSVRPE